MESKRLQPEQFYKYITEPIEKEEMALWVKAYNIKSEKTELFFDFINSLFTLIRETYLGEDIMKKEEDIKGHFTWCWDKVVSNFKKENINFNEVGNHYEYFWNFFYESFYIAKEEETIPKISMFFNRMFKLYIQKTKSELDLLSEMYSILNSNLTDR
tara:strand:- start:29 stop:499 length:471 start_codon:yes stop_codon:yes gene_type:complete